MKEKPLYPVVYMFVITCFFSLLLIGFSRYTHDKIEVNARMAFERAVVGAFPDISAPNNAAIHKVFTEQFRLEEPTNCYVYTKDGQLQGYAVPFAGPGFWDQIEGILGIAADKKSVLGIVFYEQTETPGLGARIDENDFRDQFEGIQIKHTDKPIGIRPASMPLNENEVHAITGATQTCVRLEKLMNDSLKKWIDLQGLKEQTP